MNTTFQHPANIFSVVQPMNLISLILKLPNSLLILIIPSTMLHNLHHVMSLMSQGLGLFFFLMLRNNLSPSMSSRQVRWLVSLDQPLGPLFSSR